MTSLSFPAQLNAIRVLAQMAYESAVAGRDSEAVKLLSRAQGMIQEALRNEQKYGSNGSKSTGVLSAKLGALPALSASDGSEAKGIRGKEKDIQQTGATGKSETTVEWKQYIKLLDEIAVAQLGRKYSKATEAQRKVIQDLAHRVLQGEEKEAA